MTQNNLGIALLALAERESGTLQLEKAVAAFRAALEEFLHARAEFYIETTEANLARAEALLAKRRCGRSSSSRRG